MVDIQSATAEIRRGIKNRQKEREKSQGKNIMSASATQGGHNKHISNEVGAGVIINNRHGLKAPSSKRMACQISQSISQMAENIKYICIYQ